MKSNISMTLLGALFASLFAFHPQMVQGDQTATGGAEISADILPISVGEIELILDDPFKSTIEIVSETNLKNPPRSISVNGPIFLGDKIKTDRQSARVTLSDKSEILIGPMTVLHVNQFVKSNVFPRAELTMDSGITHFKVSKSPTEKRKFEIRTPSSTFGVRGTDFIIEDRSDFSAVHTFDGSVAMAKTEEDLENPDKVEIIKAGKTSQMSLSQLKPDVPLQFSKTDYLSQLSKTAPVLVKDIKSNIESHRQRQFWKSRRRQVGH